MAPSDEKGRVGGRITSEPVAAYAEPLGSGTCVDGPWTASFRYAPMQAASFFQRDARKVEMLSVRAIVTQNG